MAPAGAAPLFPRLTTQPHYKAAMFAAVFSNLTNI